MKKTILTALLLVTITTQAQDLNWETNLNKAIATSNKTGKPLLLFFTGSDWCGWCIRLQNEVLKTPEFATWANKNAVLVELDFPRAKSQSIEIKQQNSNLQQEFQIQGYPTIWLANATNTGGKLSFEKLGSTGYVAGGPSAWLAGADAILKNNTKKTIAPTTKKSKKTKKAA